MECPVCFSCDKGAFILTNCGHNLCPQCLVAIKQSNATFRCPMCRTHVTSKPVVIQAFADTMADGVVRNTMRQVDSWFPEIAHIDRRSSSPLSTNQIVQQHMLEIPPSHSMYQQRSVPVNNVYNTRILESAAACEYNAIVAEEHRVKRWNQQLASMPTGSYFEVALSDTRHDLENGWSLYPFTNGPVTITNWMTCLEKEANDSNHRRIIIFTGEKSSEIVRQLEAKASEFIQGKHVSMNLHSELRLRGGDTMLNAPSQMSVGAHTGTWNHTTRTNNNNLYTCQVTLACRGIWVKDNTYGCRWHIF